MQLLGHTPTSSDLAASFRIDTNELPVHLQARLQGRDDSAQQTSVQNMSAGNLINLSSLDKHEVNKIPAPTIETSPNTQPERASKYSETLTTQTKVKPPASMASRTLRVDLQTVPIQIWEGTVIDIDARGRAINAILNAKKGCIPRHSAKIAMEWVSEQDADLVRPGAVFYLTLYKRTLRGTVQNSQELRFRRRPSWSATQIEQIRKMGEDLLRNMRPLPTAE
jgi:hypothetical protein